MHIIIACILIDNCLVILGIRMYVVIKGVVQQLVAHRTYSAYYRHCGFLIVIVVHMH